VVEGAVIARVLATIALVLEIVTLKAVSFVSAFDPGV
jgi:hypothetical protein